MEAELTDNALTMFDKMMGGVFCKADRQHKDNLVNRAKILDSSTRALLGMAKAMLSARANGTDPLAAVERTIGWQGLEETVEAMDQNLGGSRADNLAEVIESYPRVHRTAAIILGAFTFRSWKSTDSLLTALEVLRQLYASGERKLGFGSVKLRLAFEERADCSRCPPSIPERYKPAPYISRWPLECTCAFFPASFVRSSSIHRSLICDGCAIEKGYDQA
jgi:hypothetical protein